MTAIERRRAAGVDEPTPRRRRRLPSRRGIVAAVVTVAVIVAMSCALGACGTVGYYSQSLGGHLDVLRAARPIDDWLDDPDTPAGLRARLEKVRTMRRFAVDALALPDNRSYTTYADLKRPFVVWSVFATPELSLSLRQWCFPVVGCVAYRGYYHQDEAERYAQTFRDRGDDVYVGGIPAYSTLGYTTDPVLSTFIGFSEGEVARLIFHELAHQVVYVSGDTTFNESFAVAVEEEGVRRWFARDGGGGANSGTDGGANDAAAVAYRRSAERKKAFVELLTRHRLALQEAYARPDDDATKRDAKRREFDAVRADYAAAKRDPASALFGFEGYDRYFAQALNNANLAAVATYTQRVGAFAKLLERQHGDLKAFYRAVGALAALPPDARNVRLDGLAEGGAAASGPKSTMQASTHGTTPNTTRTTTQVTTARRPG